MKKPLELRIFPPLKLTGDRPKDRLKLEFAKGAERRKSEAKRLTDAELAAELWKAKERCMFVSAFTGFGISSDSKLVKQSEALHRFATLPHYDEDVAA